MLLAGLTAGTLGALLGIGGGPFLVPFLVLVGGLPFGIARAISLASIIAVSAMVSASPRGRSLINVRLGILLEVATTAGALAGIPAALLLPASALSAMFAATMATIAVVVMSRVNRRNIILDPEADPDLFGGRFHEDESGGVVTYQVRRLPVALGASFFAGALSTILGIGGGIVKVPVLNAWCGVPLRAAAATSAFLIGVTATTGAVVYYGRGEILPALAAGTVLGVLVGTRVGLAFAVRAQARWLKLLLAVVLLAVAALMFVGGR